MCYKYSLKMNDNYTHVDSNVFYVTENIMGPCDQSAEYEQLLNDFNSIYDENCNCQDICSQATCKCLQKSCGDNYIAYQKDGQLKYKLKPKSKSYPILECNDSCPCSIECGNRLVQKGPVEGLEIRHCDKGFGLFASCSIPSGTFLCEYAGEIITLNQASIRHYNNKMHGNNNYIFYLRELSGTNPVVTIIDPSVFGNIGRYINHSCEPNCQILPVRCGSPIPKLAIFACSNILPNEEVTFPYGSSDNSNPVTETDLIRCLCKAKSCSGFMPFHNRSLGMKNLISGIEIEANSLRIVVRLTRRFTNTSRARGKPATRRSTQICAQYVVYLLKPFVSGVLSSFAADDDEHARHTRFSLQ